MPGQCACSLGVFGGLRRSSSADAVFDADTYDKTATFERKWNVAGTIDPSSKEEDHFLGWRLQKPRAVKLWVRRHRLPSDEYNSLQDMFYPACETVYSRTELDYSGVQQVIIESVWSGTYLGSDYNFGKTSFEAAQIWAFEPGSLENTPGCSDMDHLDNSAYREGEDGNGWVTPVITNHDYFVSFGGQKIDFQSIRILFSNLWYLQNYGLPGVQEKNEGILLKMVYVNYRYRFDVTDSATGHQHMWYDRLLPSCYGDSCTIGDGISESPALTRHANFGTSYMSRRDDSLSNSDWNNSQLSNTGFRNLRTDSYGQVQVALNPSSVLHPEIIDSAAAPVPQDAAGNGLTLHLAAKQCAPRMSFCWPDRTVLGNGTYAWTDASFWGQVYTLRTVLQDPLANPTGDLPALGETVEIPNGFTVLLDTSPPKLERLTVSGILRFLDTADIHLQADQILVWGELEIGTEANPFGHLATITLHGRQDSPTLVVSDNHFIGNKVLASFGNVTLHGGGRATKHAKLRVTAPIGSKTIRLDRPVDWKVGDKLVIAPTGYDVHQMEDTLVIAAVSSDGRTVTLEEHLKHVHTCTVKHLVGKDPVHLCAAVGLLTGRNIVIRADVDAADPLQHVTRTNRHGFHIYTGEHVYAGGRTMIGRVIASGVEFHECGKTDTEHPCIQYKYYSAVSAATNIQAWFTQPLNAPTNRVKHCSFHNTLNGAIKAEKTFGLYLENNVIHHTYRNAIHLDAFSEHAVLKDNLFVGNYRSPDQSSLIRCRAEQSCVVNTFAAINLPDTAIPHILSGNIIAGAEDTGITTRWNNPCDRPNALWEDNEVYSAMVGVAVLPELKDVLAEYKCHAIRRVTVWQCAHVGLLSIDQTLNLNVDQAVLSNNHVGVSFTFMRTGYDNQVEVRDSIIMGSGTTKSCTHSGTCRTYNSDTNTLAQWCQSVYGTNVRYIGIALPRYQGDYKTTGPNRKTRKKCGLPWLSRYGVRLARNAQFRVINTAFSDFESKDGCGMESRAIALLPDEPDAFPETTLTNLTWANTDSTAKIQLGHNSLGSFCALCDAVDSAVVHDTDWTTVGHMLPKFGGAATSPENSGGATVVADKMSQFADAAMCKADTDTRSFVCRNYGGLPRMLFLETEQPLGGVLVTRKPLDPAAATATPFRATAEYGSAGNTKESACTGQKPLPKYPLKVVSSPHTRHSIQPNTGAMPNNGRLSWQVDDSGERVLVELIFDNFYANMRLYMDATSQDNKRLSCAGAGKDESPLLSLTAPTGSWSYCMKDKTLQMLVDGTHEKYEWLGALDMNVEVEIAVAIDMPANAPPNAKAAVAEQFAVFMVNYLTKKLGIDPATFKVVCVHPPGEPCLKNRKVRARRSSNTHSSRFARDVGAGAYELEYEIIAPNSVDETVDAKGAYTPKYHQNKAQAEKAIADIKKETSGGSFTRVVADAANDLLKSKAARDVSVGGVAAYGIHAASEVAGDEFAASIDKSGAVVERGSLAGTVFHDSDGNTLFGAGDLPLAGVRVLLHQGATRVLSATVDGQGHWQTGDVPVGDYTVTVDAATLPARATPYFWAVRGNAGAAGSAVTASVQSSRSAQVALACTVRATVTGRVAELADGRAVGLAGVTVSVSDQLGSISTAKTSAAGEWRAEVALGLVTVDVDERTLPFAQPYFGKATQGDTATGKVAELAGGKTLDMTYAQAVSVTGVVEEFLQGGSGNVPMHAVAVRLTGAAGQTVVAHTDEFGAWAAAVAPGEFVIEVIPSSVAQYGTDANPCFVVGDRQPRGTAVQGQASKHTLGLCCDVACAYLTDPSVTTEAAEITDRPPSQGTPRRCAAPLGARHVPWHCGGHVASDWAQGGGSGLLGWKVAMPGGEATAPGLFSTDRVSARSDGLHLEVVDMGLGWVDPAFAKGAAKCTCDAERFSTAVAVSSNVLGEGYFEAKIKTAKSSPYLASFWLLSDTAEIDIVEFTNGGSGRDGARSYSNWHCFSATQEGPRYSYADDDYEYTPAPAGQWITYGLHYSGNNLAFYRDGVLVRTVDAECLAGGGGGAPDPFNVLFSHETEPTLGGLNNPAEWGTYPFSMPASPAAMVVEHFRYWRQPEGKGLGALEGEQTTAPTAPPAEDQVVGGSAPVAITTRAVEYVEQVLRKAVTLFVEVVGCENMGEAEKSTLAAACAEKVVSHSDGELKTTEDLAQTTGECENPAASRRRRQTRFKVTLVFHNATSMSALNATIKATNAEIEASNFTVSGERERARARGERERARARVCVCVCVCV